MKKKIVLNIQKFCGKKIENFVLKVKNFVFKKFRVKSLVG